MSTGASARLPPGTCWRNPRGRHSECESSLDTRSSVTGMWGRQLGCENAARGWLLLLMATFLAMLGLAIASFASGAVLWGVAISSVMAELMWAVWRRRHDWAPGSPESWL